MLSFRAERECQTSRSFLLVISIGSLNLTSAPDDTLIFWTARRRSQPRQLPRFPASPLPRFPASPLPRFPASRQNCVALPLPCILPTNPIPIPMRPIPAASILALFSFATLSAQQPAPAVTTLSTPDKTLPINFTRIIGLYELRDGRVLVSDRGEEAVVVADFATGRTMPVGAKGSGPAEYRLPSGIRSWMGDSVVLSDQGNARLAIIGPDLKIHRSFTLTVPNVPTGFFPRAIDPTGRMYAQVSRWAANAFGQHGDSIPVVMIDPSALSGRSSPVTVRAWVIAEAEPPGQVKYGLPFVAFSPQDGWAATNDGRIAIVRSGDYHVEWIDQRGTVTRGPRIPFERIPVTRADKIAYTRSFMEGTTIGGRGGPNTTPSGESALPAEMLEQKRIEELVDQNPFAPVKPPITNATPLISPAGEVWVERSVAAAAPPEWDVFDGKGLRVARVRLPQGRKLMAVGRGTVYLVATDEDGFEKVERYRVR